MREESYTLREVAELLGVSKRTLQRRLREGAFPGRFLAPGRHGLEARIPAEDVRRALDDLSRPRQPSSPPVQRPGERLLTVLPRRELGETRTPQPAADPVALTLRDLDGIREAVLSVVREDREGLVALFREAFDAREREVAVLRTQIAAVASNVERVRRMLESAPPRREHEPSGAGWSESFALLRELEGIERELAGLTSDGVTPVPRGTRGR